MIESTPDKFARLAERWRRDTAHLSNTDDTVSHTAYQEIIRMGWDAVPLMIAELREGPEHWFAALLRITGVNPVPAAYAGHMQVMAKLWIQWFDARQAT